MYEPFLGRRIGEKIAYILQSEHSSIAPNDMAHIYVGVKRRVVVELKAEGFVSMWLSVDDGLWKSM
jgi:hypothetical protein